MTPVRFTASVKFSGVARFIKIYTESKSDSFLLGSVTNEYSVGNVFICFDGKIKRSHQKYIKQFLPSKGMLDVQLLREHADIVRADIKKRHKLDKLPLVDEFVGLDMEWRELKSKNDALRHERNKVSLQISEHAKQKKDTTVLKKKAKEIPDKIAESDVRIAEIEARMNGILYKLPNIMHQSVPSGKSDADNKEVKRVGSPKAISHELKTHTELAESHHMADFEQGTVVAGKGFNYIHGKKTLIGFWLLFVSGILCIIKEFVIIPINIISKSFSCFYHPKRNFITLYIKFKYLILI